MSGRTDRPDMQDRKIRADRPDMQDRKIRADEHHTHPLLLYS